MLTRRPNPLVALVCAVAIVAAGCGGGAHAGAHKHRHKREVLIHASLGFGAFRWFISVPAHAGQLSNPLSPASKNASAAAEFAYRELRLAGHHVEHSKRLRILFAPLEVAADKIKALAPVLSQPHSLAQVEAITNILARLATIARDNGARIEYASSAGVAAAGGPRA